ALLAGGRVCADSGDLTRWQGITALGSDGRFWHPDGDVADRPRSSYGFPTVPGMFDAVRRPFAATGLAMPWLAVHGNHDRLLQGTVPAAEVFARVAVGDRKGIGLADDWSADEVVALLTGLAECEPAALARLGEARTATVTADPSRRPVSRAEFVAAHFGPGARPVGHGFGDDQRRSGDAYYRHDREGVTLLVLDTVDEHGGWQGSLDRAQFDWLQGQLAAADAEQRLVVLASHHPLDDLVNAAGPSRVLGGEIAHLLTGHRCVVLWLNGHSHTTTVTARRTFWEVTTPSLIDRPQHARLVELLRAGDRLVVATTMVDHVGEAPWSGAIDSPTALAGLSRELAANDWQQVIGEPSGTARDRNVLLPLRDPFAS
ncbi:MAG: TIGR03767 family metallophosphoesterase, partial [Jatrophihabitans sp.]